MMKRLERFAAILAYDPETGILTWREKPSRGVKKGAVAGEEKKEGYRRIKLGGEYEYAHRIAWFIMTGKAPNQEIDHLNTIRSDNRWVNLREATSTTNKQNRRKARSDSKTGVLGATPNKKGFMAKIRVDGKSIYLGTYSTTKRAHAIYVAAKRKLHLGNTL